MSLSKLQLKLQQLEKEMERTYADVEQLLKPVEQVNKEQVDNGVFSYFSHSVILDYEKSTSHLVIGSFHVKNTSNISQNSPIILLKIISETEFNFSGKFISKKQVGQAHNFVWERLKMDHLDPNTHFCFKRVSDDRLKPYEQLSFENFQIKVPLNASINVEGFVYFDQNNEGIQALNSVNVSI